MSWLELVDLIGRKTDAAGADVKSFRVGEKSRNRSESSQQRQRHHRGVRVDGTVLPRSAPMSRAYSIRSFAMRFLLPLAFLAWAGGTIETPAPVHTTYVTPAPTTTYVTPAAPTATVVQTPY
jgi:hypothetical protein